MDRLTKKAIVGWEPKFADTIFGSVKNATQCYNRLVEYEDTGLTPEEIAQMNDFAQSQCIKLLAENARLKAEIKQILINIPGTETADDVVEYLGKIRGEIFAAQAENERLKAEVAQLRDDYESVKSWNACEKEVYEKLHAENKLFRQREQAIAQALGVCDDGGEYVNDIVAAVEKLKAGSPCRRGGIA